MKKLLRIISSAIVMVALCVACLSFSACQDIKQIEVKVSVYSSESVSEDYTLTVDLYRHLASETVDSILQNAKEGYYDNAIVYKNAKYTSQLMVGDLKLVDGKIVANEVKPAIKGEFASNGVTGSDLKAERGTIGLWRSWTAKSDSYTVSDAGRNSGSATWFIPTSSITSYDGNFCVFAKIDLTNETNEDAFSVMETIFSSSENYEEFEVYYTGEADNLTFNMVEKSEFNEEDESIFKAEGDELVCYNHYTVRIPTDNNRIVIKSVTVK